MSAKDFDCLLQKSIYELLDGDVILVKKDGKDIGMPYLKGSSLVDLAKKFGVRNDVGGSRWTIMAAILEHVVNVEKVSEFLSYMFNFSRFDFLKDYGDMATIKQIYDEIVDAAISNINSQLVFSGKELKIVRDKFVIVNLGYMPVIEAPVITMVDAPYIQGLRDRIKDNLESGEFDSARLSRWTAMGLLPLMPSVERPRR